MPASPDDRIRNMRLFHWPAHRICRRKRFSLITTSSLTGCRFGQTIISRLNGRLHTWQSVCYQSMINVQIKQSAVDYSISNEMCCSLNVLNLCTCFLDARQTWSRKTPQQRSLATIITAYRNLAVFVITFVSEGKRSPNKVVR